MDEKKFFGKTIEERVWLEIPRNFRGGIIGGFLSLLVFLISGGEVAPPFVTFCGIIVALIWGIGDGLFKRMGVSAGVVAAITAAAGAASIPAVIVLAEYLPRFIVLLFWDAMRSFSF